MSRKSNMRRRSISANERKTHVWFQNLVCGLLCDSAELSSLGRLAQLILTTTLGRGVFP